MAISFRIWLRSCFQVIVSICMQDCNYISLSSLKDRGWTEGIIKKIGVVPDKEVVNPHYKNSAPMKLYDVRRIEGIEASDEFKTLYDTALKRRMAAKKAAETKMQSMKDYVHSIEIKMPMSSKEQVFRRAVAHYNALWEWRGCYDKHISDYRILDNATLERLTANMIRHSMTDYDSVLERNYGKVGVEYAHDYLKEKINKMVHDTYFQDVA